MDTSKQAMAATFEQAVLKAKVAQICDHVGYHAITQDSSNVLVDIYQRMICHLGRQCKDSANNNRRIESTIVDLIQACDIVGVSIPGLQEHIETVKLPLVIDIQQDEPRPSNRIQRNLLVDDLLESEKNNREDAEDGENKALSESGIEEDENSNVPLLKDTYDEIVNKFPACQPVVADKKIRLGGRILFVANTKLKISAPIPPEPVPSTSGIDSKLGKKKKRKEVERKKQRKSELTATQLTPVKQTKGKRKKKISREFVVTEPTPEKELEPESVDLKIEDEPVEEKISSQIEDVQSRLEEERMEREREIEREREEEQQRERLREEERLRELQKELEKEKEVAEKDREKIKVKGRGRGKGKNKEKEKSKNKLKLKNKDKSKDKSKDKEKDKDRSKNRESKKNLSKKPKVIVTPLDPAIAEPPSFLPILDMKVEVPEPVDLPIVQHEPATFIEPAAPPKQLKTKKKKKSSNQFAIVTETVTKAEEKEYFCPACGGPDDGDVMVECDTCQEWYHLRCIGLKKVPEDHETWECDLCVSKKRAAQKRPMPTLNPIKVKLEVPEPVVTTPPPPPPPPPAQPTPNQPVATGSTSQDDLCPECSLPDDGTLMIQCDDPFCAKWFHGKCVDLLEEPKEDESWFCKACVDKQQSAFKRRRRAK